MPDMDAPRSSRLGRALAAIERAGNRLPDPALLFVLLLGLVWLASWLLSGIDFGYVDPRNGEPLRVHNQLSGAALTAFMANMVPVFTGFHPVGVVLVALLGIGVAEHSGFIQAALRGMLSVTRPALLTPMVILVGVLSSIASDAGYVLVIPLGGIIFRAAGRHPLAGIAAAFAGVSGAYSATLVPTSLEPLLAGLTEAGAQILDPAASINPLNNYYFTTASTLLLVSVGWWLTDRVVEPRLRGTAIEGEGAGAASMTALDARERRALLGAGLAMLAGVLLVAASALPADSAWRGPAGSLTEAGAPMMRAIVALIFVLFLLPGIVYGWLSGSMRGSKAVFAGMSQAMSTMGYYLVLMFFIAQFIAAFSQSNLGVLMALAGASGLQALALPSAATIVGMVLMVALLNLFIGSASAKWALLAPVVVPMLMQVGISPDLTQAAYRVGDSSTTIITPLMPYFPLVVVYCQRWVRNAGVGTLVAMMLPYSLVFLLLWTAFLLLYWGLGLPLGLNAAYTWP